MNNSYNTNTSGGDWTKQQIDAVWRKGRIVSGYDGNVYRKDGCDAWMKYSDWGNTNQYGWEIDHINPSSNGGSDELSNLQPLQWKIQIRQQQ